MQALDPDRRRELRWRRPLALFTATIFINYPWERIQAQFYIMTDGSRIGAWLCFLASLGDGLLVLLIYVVGRVALRRQDWFVRPGVLGYALMLVAGLLISITIEWITVQVAEWWTYTEQMPIVPGLGIGIVPLAQMLVLPSLVFRIVTLWPFQTVSQ